eukprot:s43_g4.t1
MGSPVHICLIQETHWSLESEWQTEDHFLIHSGNSNKKAGILILIDKSFVKAQEIRTRAHIPGRLVQLRLDTEPAIIIFAVYQHVWGDASANAGEDLQRRREDVWTTLHSAVRGTPWRAQLILAGDFNTPCLPEPSLAGTGIPHVHSIRQADQPRLQQLITAFSLNVLNTWQRRKHAYTYRFPRKDGLQQTQIDFVMMRASQVDAVARCARPLRTPFVPLTGMHHLPILVSLPRPSRPKTVQTSQAITASTVNALLRDHPSLTLRFQAQVQQLRRLRNDPSVAHTLLRRWLVAARLAKLQRQLERICRDKKRERINGILQEAAASPHLSAIYGAIRRLAPKSRHQRIQLRDKQGNLLSPHQETETIADFFRQFTAGGASPQMARGSGDGLYAGQQSSPQSRSTADALESICAHLQAVRSLVQSKSTALLQRYRGSQPTKLAGGISISLDIHKAFDSLSHSFLAETMQQALFDPGEIDLILHLHEQADMQFGASSHISHVYLASGIRQGCSLSPLLWSLATGLIFKRYTTALQSAHLRSDTASLYADDAFASWVFRDSDSFRHAIRAMGLLILTCHHVVCHRHEPSINSVALQMQH